MQTRKLGYTDLHLSTVGFGTATIGGGRAYGWTPADDSESIAAIHRALELGVNWIDTALFYGDGNAERLTGEAMAALPVKVAATIPIATKCLVDRKYIQHPNDSIAEGIIHQAESSLKRLKRDVIDLYQIHWPPKNEDVIEEAWSAMAGLVKAGKIRYAGVSNFNVEQMRRAQAIHPVASLQPPYSLLDRTIEKELLPYCAANNIGVIAYSPMQSGLLTGNLTREYVASLPASDWRKKTDPNFRDPRLGAILAFVEKLRPIAKRNGRSVGQLAIAWALQRPEVTAVIIGGRSPAQVGETVPAGDWTLSADDSAEVEALLLGEGLESRKEVL
jgi:aryl-alcohol dehydrogenase-like predicted oxidoreductase